MPFTDSIKVVDVVITTDTTLTATPSDVVAGKSFIGSTRNIESGSLPVNPTRNDVTIAAGESFNIPNGVNPVSYNVIAQGLNESTAGTAEAGDILTPKTAWVNGEKVEGQMLNIGKEEATVACGQTHQISRGFHDGSGSITGMSLFDQTPASIIADDILEGDDCWANGEHITGSMPNIGKVTISLDAGESYNIPKGFHNGEGTVKAPGLTYQTSGSASASEIVEGYTAWVNGEKVTGIMPKNSDEEIILPPNGEYTIPYGYHTGRGKIVQNIPSMGAQTIGPAKESQTISCAGYVMEGDITITGVDALNYQRPNAVVKDSTNVEVSNYNLSVSGNSTSIAINTDNWHDNATLNVYSVVFTDLVDSNGNSMNLSCLLMLDWKDQITKTYTFGNVSISTKLQDGTNAHLITINGINSGKITITEIFSAREFGIEYPDEDE